MSTHNAPNRLAPAAYIALTAVGLLVVLAGALLVGVHATKRDGEGFYASGANALGTPTRALVSSGLDIYTDGPDWNFHDGRFATIKVTATGTKKKPIFIGLARKAEIAAYLHGVARDEIRDLQLNPFSVDRKRHDGSGTPPVPSDKHFWAESASGAGRQAVRWPAHKGSWGVVVMNADASPGVQTKIAVGAKVPAILWIGVGALGVGAALLGGGGIATYRGLRGPSRRGTAVTVTTKPQPNVGGGA